MPEVKSAPLVSIITPTYNHEKYINECVASVIAQTYDHWEQVVMDDGSTDATPSIVKQYNDPRIRYLWQENRGIGALDKNYNRALSLCRGELIAILEGDDTWPPTKLETMVGAFLDPEVVLAFGKSQDIDEKGVARSRESRTSRLRSKLPHSVLLNDPIRSATPYLLSANGQTFIPPSTVVVRRSALESIGGFQKAEGVSPVDVPTFIRLSLIGEFHFFDEILGNRRHHAQSATVQNLRTMTDIAETFALACAEDPSFGLTAEQRKAVLSSWNAVKFSAEFWLGRICLLNRDCKQARRHFAAALGASDIPIVVAAALGWVLSWFKFDLEGIARMAGRATLAPPKIS